MTGFVGTKVFVQDERLGIPLPRLDRPWEHYSLEEQSAILAEWESIRGMIPDRIAALERRIEQKLNDMGREDDFLASCVLNDEMADLAGRINDLQIWYRVRQETAVNKPHR